MTTTMPTLPLLRRYVLRRAILGAQTAAFITWSDEQSEAIDGDFQPHEWQAAIDGLSAVQRLEIERLSANALNAADFATFDALLQRFGGYHHTINGKEDRSYVALARSSLLNAWYATRQGEYLDAIKAANESIRELRFVTDRRKRKSSDTFRHLRPEVRDGLRLLANDIETFTARLTKARAA